MQNKKKLVIAVGRRYGIRLVDSEFDLKSIYDFIELFIPTKGDYARDRDRARLLHDFEVECARVLLEKLRAREIICDSDFYIIIADAAYNLGLINSAEREQLLDIFNAARYSKTWMNKEFFAQLTRVAGIAGKTLYNHYKSAVRALHDVGLITVKFDKNIRCRRFYLARPSTFQDRLLILSRFYSYWYEGGDYVE